MNRIIILCFLMFACRSQEKVASIDLINNSEEYEVTVKKKQLHFGSYQTIKTKRKQFNTYENEILGIKVNDNNEVFRYTFTSEENLSAEITAAGNIDAERINQVKNYTLQLDGNNILLAKIVKTGTLEQWELIAQNVYKDLNKSGETKGELTNGETSYRIEGLSLNEHPLPEKKKGVVDGYQIYKDDKAIAAVQTYTTSNRKKYVWLNKSLPEDEKFIIAAACSALIIKRKSIAD